MSRTHKDTRAAKEIRRKRTDDPIQRKYKEAKRNASAALCDGDFCPECGGLTNFSSGFLTCSECNWSTFETEELNFLGFNFNFAA